MITARHRFHGHGAIRAVYRSGRTIRGPAISLTFAARAKDRGYRAAVVVSRKVHKSAIKRNRIRRRIYEIIRQAAPELKDGKDLVLTVFNDRAATIESDRLKEQVENLLAKAGSAPLAPKRTTGYDRKE